jgi:ribosome-associated protein
MATMPTIRFEINQDHIRLCDLLKLTDVVQSGAQGKHLVGQGRVTVDQQPESRKTAKIRAGQVVQVAQITIQVVAA